MADPKRKHEDTSVSLHPRTFREAVKELADFQWELRLWLTSRLLGSTGCGQEGGGSMLEEYVRSRL